MDAGKDLPVISSRTAALLSILFTLIYVLPFYLFPSTRPSPTLNRDAPSVIRARIRTVSLACLISTLATLCLILDSTKNKTTTHDHDFAYALHLLGYRLFPLQQSIFNPLLLTLLLFLGPLFESLLTQPVSPSYYYQHLLSLPASLSKPVPFRNYIAGPLTEEILFRSVLIPLHLLSHHTPAQITFLTPLYFGIAHIHHFYEYRLTHPYTPVFDALLRSLFQLGYTTLFGWYAAFVYLRTGSLVTVVLVHSFCNWCGLPRFWGRLERLRIEPEEPVGPPIGAGGRSKEDDQGNGNVRSGREVGGGDARLGVAWTVVYYLLLSLGAYGFYEMLWPLTSSDNALVDFGKI